MHYEHWTVIYNDTKINVVNRGPRTTLYIGNVAVASKIQDRGTVHLEWTLDNGKKIDVDVKIGRIMVKCTISLDGKVVLSK